MLRIILRFIGLMLAAAGFAAIVVDGTRSIASNAVTLTSLGEMASHLAPQKMTLLQPAIEKKFGHWAWDPAMTFLLALPGWLVLGGIGALIFLATRRRKAQIGYSSR